jgi:hypothetical protein
VAYEGVARGRLDTANTLAELGAEYAALAALAEGMRAIMDLTSPAHEGYQVWDAPPNHDPRAWIHVMREAVATPSRYGAAVEAMRRHYQRFRRGICK